MAGKRPRKRAYHESKVVNVLAREAAGWKAVRRVGLMEALTQIARRQWRAIWYEDGSLAGVEFAPPQSERGEIIVRCGSVECLKWWVERAQLRLEKREPVVVHESAIRTVLIDLFEPESDKVVRRVSAALALKKIALSEWNAIWFEDGKLAGVRLA